MADIAKICLQCNKEFKTYPCRVKKGKGKYCSHKCYWKDLKNKKPPNYKDLIAYSKRNQCEKHHLWKGQYAGYTSIHKWVYKILGKPMECEFCGIINKGKRSYHWVNVDHRYKRNIEDWMRLCVPCHSKYDRGVNRG